ncbi:MAG: hypothetical protein NE334_19530 [Lentisphaeraceae bacterium]|nr:hypothetical protein [Lentisphaeraceae bacterium]
MKKFAINLMWLSLVMTVLIISSDKKSEYQEKLILKGDSTIETAVNLGL